MTITLEVNGTEYKDFTDAEATIALDQFVNTFSFGAVSQEPRGFPVAVGDAVRVLVDGTAVVSGFVETLRGAHSAKSRTIKIMGSSKTADVVDSTVNQIVLTTPISLKSVIEAVLAEIGSPLTVTDEVADLKDFEKGELIAAKPGQGAFDLIEQFARKRQVFVRTGTDGNILISRNAGADPVATLLSRIKDNDNNVKSASVTVDHTGRFNTYVARSQKSQTALFSFGEDPGAANVSDQSGRATDDDIRSERTLVFVTENATDNDGLAERSTWEANIRRARSLIYQPVVVGHTISGAPWAVNQTVKVTDEWEDIDAVMLVDLVTFQFSNTGGVTTQLRCVSPDSYTLQASEPQKQKQTNTISGIFGG